MAKAPKKAKLPKGVDETFVQNIQGMTSDQLKAEVVRLQMYAEEVNKFKETPAYIEAKGKLDELKAPVTDTLTAIRNKTKLLVERLNEKGS